MKAKLYCGARLIHGKPIWTVEVIAKKTRGYWERWRGSGYSTRSGAIRQGHRAADDLKWTLEGSPEGMEP